jgi:secreted PhoX family phosphatase
MSSNLHPDSRLHDHNDAGRNDSENTSILDLIEQRTLSRRSFITSVGTTAALAVVGGSVMDSLTHTAEAATRPPVKPRGTIGFTSVPPNLASTFTDQVTVPPGYSAKTLIAWGDSLTNKPGWDPAKPMTEATQLRTFGSHIDGMHYFPNSVGGNSRGLLVTNHEYCDPPLVNNVTPPANYATMPVTLAMVRAQQAAHGISVVSVVKKGKNWTINRSSRYNRRVTANTPCAISGPAAGHDLMKTAADPTGTQVLGTLNNCAHGYTPWGTYLTCEENWNGYFSNESGDVTGEADADRKAKTLKAQTRYGVVKGGFGYRWHEADERFRADLNPNEPNRFGWVVEIDPWNPESTPVKRTALGRFKHESAMYVVDPAGVLAVYMGDDERNEYIYKFVSTNRYKAGDDAANRQLLDSGILHVARFAADGTGVWLPLVWGENGLTPENGFADQGEVLIKTRQAADRLGATMMDRPEWVAAHPDTREVYVTLTNNSRRGNTPASANSVDGTSNSASANPVVDAANPRPDNDFGHIIRWREKDGKADATTFEWDIFVQCGDKATTKTLGSSYTADGHDGYRGNIKGDDYGAPDGLWFDREGRLWIQTDQVGNATGDWVNIGGNVMMCADPVTGETRRFLTSPRNCEVTGVVGTPDGKNLFVGIQHPGEDWVDSYTQNSNWPDSGINGPTTRSKAGAVKPRSGVVVITRDDGGVVGT